MSVEASQDGGFELADVLAEAASQYLDQAELMEGAGDAPSLQYSPDLADTSRSGTV